MRAAGIEDRRDVRRLDDGSETDVRKVGGPSFIGRIVDVGSDGVQLWTAGEVAEGELVTCRIQFERFSTDLPLRVVWTRRSTDGWQCGTRYDPVINRGARLIDSYRLFVLHRRQRSLDDAFVS